MSRSLQSILERSILYITLPNNQLCTAWILDKSGLIVTAGHVFEQQENDELYAECCASSGLSLGRAKLICCKYDPAEDTCDFAILRLEKALPRLLVALELDTRVEPATSEQFCSIGFFPVSGQLGPASAPLTGQIDGKVTPNIHDPLSYKYRLLTSTRIESGYSGAPIVGQNGKVIGIIAGRIPHKELGASIGWATPISAIVSQARLKDIQSTALLRFRTDYLQPIQQLASLLPNQVHLHSKMDSYRIGIIISPSDNNSIGSEIISIYTNLPNKVDSITVDITAPWPWLSSNVSVDFKPEFRNYIQNTIDPISWNNYVGNEAQFTIYEGDLPLVRILVDSCVGLPHVPITKINGLERISHGITVHLQNGPDSISRTANSIIVQSNSSSELVKTLEHCIENLMLDINVFHKTVFLPLIYSTLEARRSFSISKYYFLKSKKVPGYRLLEENGTYTIAEFCRSSDDGRIDRKKYQDWWEEFLTYFLLSTPASVDRSNSTYADLVTKAIVEALRQHPKLEGQIGERNIRKTFGKRFLNTEKKTSELHVFVIAVKRPKNNEIAETMAAFFGKKHWTRNMSLLIPYRNLSSISGYLGYLKLVFVKC